MPTDDGSLLLNIVGGAADITTALANVVNIAKNVSTKMLSDTTVSKTATDFVYQDFIERHLTYVVNWSSKIGLPGLGPMKSTDTESIALNLHGTPRRFRGMAPNETRRRISAATPIDRSESELLTSPGHFVLLGDPGAGKTTTLKRLILKLLTSDSLNDTDTYQFPILIRLKEVGVYEDMCSLVCNTMGFPVRQVSEVEKVESRVRIMDANGRPIKIMEPKMDADGRLIRDSEGNAVMHFSGKYEEDVVIKEQVVKINKIGDRPMKEFVIDFLNRSQAVLLIDGLDELDDKFNDGIARDLRELGLHLNLAKIIVTCRSGAFQSFRSLEGFSSVELLSLEDSQIEELASLWIDNPREFLDQLVELPYRDFADRPLLLSQLVMIFQRQKSLPRSPKAIYVDIFNLLLKDWDLDRGIRRTSKYSDFGPEMKREFLAELGFNLMYRRKKLSFDKADLIDVYKSIHAHYYLPIHEAEDVASEIETHTGILVRAGYNKYEFSHLSLHEYLSASYIVRSPLSLELRDILASFPEPVAIAISLAGNSSRWFSGLVMEPMIFDVLSANMHAFLKRLISERPAFVVDEEFGFAIFNVFYSGFTSATGQLRDIYQEFFRLRGVSESVSMLLANNRSVKLRRRRPRSREIEVSFALTTKTAAGHRFVKTFITTTNDLRNFFALFGLPLKASHISKAGS